MSVLVIFHMKLLLMGPFISIFGYIRKVEFHDQLEQLLPLKIADGSRVS